MKLSVYEPKAAPPPLWVPCEDRLLVRKFDSRASDLLSNGVQAMIIRPSDSGRPTIEDDCEWGRVIAVGPGKRDPESGRRIPLDSRPGDLVLFKDWVSGQSLNLGEYALIQEADVRLKKR